MALRTYSRSLAWLGLICIASAQVVIDSLSFGHKGMISPQGHGIPGWQPSTLGHELQILSDRVILTPPYPGSTKGGLWTDTGLSSADWSAEMEFRVTGQDGSSGNIQMFLTSDKARVGINSIYNVEQFDGLAIVIDQYGGRGGSIRGFLNDGSQNFRTHHSLESLAFANCEYSYRNLGRLSKLKVQHNQNAGLSVTIDDRPCFSTKSVSLPAQNHFFGVTAATGENPDSFEVHKFVISGGTGMPMPNQGNQGSQAQQQVNSPPPSQYQKMDRFPGSPETVADASPDDFKSQNEQFADLHNRIQTIMHQITNVFADMNVLSQKIDLKHNELMNAVHNMQGSRDTGLPPDVVNTINQLKSKVDNLERTAERIKSDVEGQNYKDTLANLQRTINNIEAHPEIVGKMIQATTPKMGWFIGIVLSVQILLAGAYIVYKRRRSMMPKKYL